MTLSPQSIFVVRVWQERDVDTSIGLHDLFQGRWRACVTHPKTGERRYFADPVRLAEYVMGVTAERQLRDLLSDLTRPEGA